MPLPSLLIDEGSNRNLFLQDENINVHAVWRRNPPQRLIFAFPEGNSGVGVGLDGDLELLPTIQSWTGGNHHGAEVTFEVRGKVVVGTALLDTVRTLRDWRYPEALASRRAFRRAAGVADPQWCQDPAGHRLRMEDRGMGGRWSLCLELSLPPEVKWEPSAEGGTLSGPLVPWRLTVRAGHDRPLFVPLGEENLLSVRAQQTLEALPPGSARDAALRARRHLAFQVFREKVVAGSWQYLTYFGRDTLLTSLLLGPTASAAFHEIVVTGALERLSPVGQVAHEEDLGEQIWYGTPRGNPPLENPVYDYKMVDDDFLLLPAIRALADHPDIGATWLAAFVRRHGAAIERNASWCLSRLTDLVAIRHESVGDWRDSSIGLGGGVFPNSVNVGLAPVFVEAWSWYQQHFATQGFPQPQREFWAQVPGRFEVVLSAQQVRNRLSRALASWPKESLERRWLEERASHPLPPGGLTFSALSLDSQRRPVEVVNSDFSFRLFLSDPGIEELGHILTLLELPYPLGLAHPVGFLTANPLLSDRSDLWRSLGRQGYHGAVVWGWQDAMILLGLRRQRRRTDLPPTLQRRLDQLETQGRAQRQAAGAFTGSELWTWSVDENGVRPQAFGAAVGDETEANVIQLWSSATLALENLLAPPH